MEVGSGTRYRHFCNCKGGQCGTQDERGGCLAIINERDCWQAYDISMKWVRQICEEQDGGEVLRGTPWHSDR